MSSFVIDKKEYIKAAGISAGLAFTLDREFFVYDYELGRKMKQEDFYNKFCEFYKMNAISVAEQYGDAEIETDESDQHRLFNEWRVLGEHLAMRSSYKVQQAVKHLSDFLRSAAYQTEKDAYYFKMTMFFDKLIRQLYEKTTKLDCECWGDLDKETFKALLKD